MSMSKSGLLIFRLVETHPNLIFPNIGEECKTVDSRVTVVCPVHGNIGTKSVDNMLYGKTGCGRCSARVSNFRRNKYKAKEKEDFFNKVGLSLRDPESLIVSRDKIPLICKTHGVIYMTTKQVMRGHGCRRCSSASPFAFTYEKMAKIASVEHNGEYTYEKISDQEVKGLSSKVFAVCKKHGAWVVSFSNHIHLKTKCPKCRNKSSKAETELFQYVKNICSDAEQVRYFHGKKPDIFIESKKTVIDYNGLYWHSSKHMDRLDHKNKREFYESFGLRYVIIWEDEWPSEKIKGYLQALLGSTKNIYARKCDSVLLGSKEARIFLDKNHLMGAGLPCSYNVALIYNKEVVAVSSFRKVFGRYELYRAAYLSGHRVVGGLSKMLSLWKKDNKKTLLVSYIDLDKFSGVSYWKAGFIKDKLSISMSYIKRGVRVSRHLFKKNMLTLTEEEKSMTEKEILEGRGIYQAYNSGTLKVVLKDP